MLLFQKLQAGGSCLNSNANLFTRARTGRNYQFTSQKTGLSSKKYLACEALTGNLFLNDVLGDRRNFFNFIRI